MYTIYRCVRGSHATGLATPESDRDTLRVVIPDKSELLGLHPAKSGQLNDGVVDERIITLKDLIFQAVKGRSTEIEWLFVNPEHIHYKNEFGDRLLDFRDNLISLKMLKSLIGTATGNRGKSPKKMSHALRSLYQAIKLKTYGRLPVVASRMYHDTILGVKTGDISMTVAESLFETWKDLFDSLESKVYLREEPDVKKINEWLVETHELFLNKS